MKQVAYALVHEASGAYGVSFPDFPGCVSGGRSLAEALERGRETLGFHVCGMIEDGEALPVPRTLKELRADPRLVDDFRHAIVAPVAFDRFG